MDDNNLQTALRRQTAGYRRISGRHSKQVNIMGIRGIPAAHGGFETFAGRLAPYLRDRGWKVNVYCQLEPDPNGMLAPDFEDDWDGIHRIHLGTRQAGSVASMIFDWRCTVDVQRRQGVDLILGYNTAIFMIPSRLLGRRVVMNMDGIEWKRAKWSSPVKAWFLLNEFVGANVSSLPIADHPEIARHLQRHWCNRSVVIPYGADTIENAPADRLATWGLESKAYFISIARIEPENSILDIVVAFSAARRGVKLMVLGKLDLDNAYHRAVRAAASSEVAFPGAIYDETLVGALRFHCLAYLHGHQVGGTNPSLVEALGAGCAVIAHNNRFNRWVAGPDQIYFDDAEHLKACLNSVLGKQIDLTSNRASARSRHAAEFRWEKVLEAYEAVLHADSVYT